jgi:hypothetical protein
MVDSKQRIQIPPQLGLQNAEVRLIYQIYCGSNYGYAEQDFIVECNEVHDLAKLEEEYLTYYDNPSVTTIQYQTQHFHQTERFIEWLVTFKGFSRPDVQYFHTEN